MQSAHWAGALSLPGCCCCGVRQTVPLDPPSCRQLVMQVSFATPTVSRGADEDVRDISASSGPKPYALKWHRAGRARTGATPAPAAAAWGTTRGTWAPPRRPPSRAAPPPPPSMPQVPGRCVSDMQAMHCLLAAPPHSLNAAAHRSPAACHTSEGCVLCLRMSALYKA